MRERVTGVSAVTLRRELSARNLARAAGFDHETSYGQVASVVYREEAEGTHGNFLPGVYQRILANPAWKRRLNKVYTGSAWIARAKDRSRAELECCTSSDALLMNIFCYPRVLHGSKLCGLLGVEVGLIPQFGVRAGLMMRGGETDRTEFDLQLGELLIESKLSESGFGRASRERLLRYDGVAEVFDLEALPWGPRGVAGYQIIRGAVCAVANERRYLLLVDRRRTDLQEQWLRVLRAMHSSAMRSRMLLLTWQELATTLPKTIRDFLASKYGIEAAS